MRVYLCERALVGVTRDRILRQNVNTEAVRKFRKGLQVLGDTDALWILNGKKRLCCFTGRAGLTSHHMPSVSFKPRTVSSCCSVSELSLHLAPSDMDSSALSLSTIPPLRLLSHWLPATLYYEHLGESQGALSVSLPPSPPLSLSLFRLLQ